jgi:trehalose synthase
MAPALQAAAAALIWRCHIGVDIPNPLVRETWSFLMPYVRHANRTVFSRESFVWDGLDRAKVAIIAPTIDPFALKNQHLSAEDALVALRTTA